ncbi:DUF1843 domain-containing protein [Beijerinckia sp. L45]|uniref:DUF1843 domain-containing protein n=1 Tax=Beijerinckia sp. L45 TaxID=1641855 RepID=UPI00131E6482|nr:DUF1843 domain-containing protein [Beijerinckia sp. L45]
MTTIRPLYMVTVTDAICKGDLAEMKKLRAECEKHIADHGDIASLLSTLQVEIAKAEHGAKRK